MAEMKNVPELVFIGESWELTGFVPGQASRWYKDFSGRKGTLYVLELQEYCKIGVSRDFPKRLASINKAMPFEVNVAKAQKVPLSALMHTEAWMHRLFKNKIVKNEWFKMPASEALSALPQAVLFSKVFDRYCSEWNGQNIGKSLL